MDRKNLFDLVNSDSVKEYFVWRRREAKVKTRKGHFGTSISKKKRKKRKEKEKKIKRKKKKMERPMWKPANGALRPKGFWVENPKGQLKFGKSCSDLAILDSMRSEVCYISRHQRITLDLLNTCWTQESLHGAGI